MGVLQLGDILAEPVVGIVSLGLIFYALIARLRAALRHPGRGGLGGGGRDRLLRAAAPSACCTTRWRCRRSTFPIGFPCRRSASWTGCRPRSAQYLPMAMPVRDPHRDRRHQRDGERAPGRRRLPHALDPAHRGGGHAGRRASAAACRRRRRTSAIPPTRRWAAAPPTRWPPGCSSGWAGSSGYIPFLAMILPIACLAPILIFVAFDIVAQAFHESPRAARARGRASPSSRPWPSSCSSPWTR